MRNERERVQDEGAAAAAAAAITVGGRTLRPGGGVGWGRRVFPETCPHANVTAHKRDRTYGRSNATPSVRRPLIIEGTKGTRTAAAT